VHGAQGFGDDERRVREEAGVCAAHADGEAVVEVRVARLDPVDLYAN
jgi:hypothetical protein